LRNITEANRAALLYQRGEDAWRRGRLRSAFRLLLAAAEAGLPGAFGTLGNFFHLGRGVRANPDAALYWYKRAYRDGDRSVANNIGCVLRDRNQVRQAIKWFQRAVRQDDGNANLNIAKIYLRKGYPAGALPYLNKTCRSAWATEGAKEEARFLLKKLTTKNAARSGLRQAQKSGPLA
ncbi:MAG: hypothetical protein ACRD4Y_13780, partial [Candidatus Acidiferrales bacterium]